MLLQWWKRKDSNGIVGLDISDDFVKLLKINALAKTFQVENFAISKLPPGVMVKGEVKEKSTLIRILNDIFKEISSKNVAISVPRSSVIIKTTTIDKRLLPHEIEQRAWIEAENQFSGLAQNIFLDFNITGPSQKEPIKNELMLIACRKEQINPYIDLLKNASLTPKIIDVSSYALERALLQTLKDKETKETVALLNIDLSLSTLVVLHQKEFIYAFDHPFEGNRLIKQVSQHEIKNREQPLEDQDYKNILRERLSAHLRHMMHHFYSNRPNITIQQLLLSGDCSHLPSLDVYVQQEINAETKIADPFLNMTFSKNVDKEKLDKIRPQLMLACGLALSRV